MSEVREARNTFIMSPYGNFLTPALSRLFMLSITGDPESYFKAVRSFKNYLPNNVKTEVEKDFKAIDKRVSTIRESYSGETDRYRRQEKVQLLLLNLYSEEADRMIDKIVSLLDTRGFVQREQNIVTSASLEALDKKSDGGQ